MRTVILFSAALIFSMPAAELKPATAQAYQAYIEQVQRNLDKRSNFLLIDSSEGLRERVKNGELFVEERRPRNDPPGGLAHHWEGAVFIPKATLPQVLASVQNYDNHKNLYKPEVIDSKTLKRSGDQFLFRLRLLKKKILTVVMETEHSARYKQRGPLQWESSSHTTKVNEVHDAGTPKETQLPPGTGHGFVWRMDTFWRFMEADGGVYVECTSVSLSRDIPFGMSRLLRPVIEDLPQESLTGVLRNTRRANEK